MSVAQELLSDSFLSSVIWAVFFAIIAFTYHHQLRDLISTLTSRFQHAPEFKVMGIEVSGIPRVSYLDSSPESVGQFTMLDALDSDEMERQNYYLSARNIVFVHSVSEESEKNGYQSVVLKLSSHYRRSAASADKEWLGKLNDVKSVTYYLGSRFGKHRGYKHGVLYRNENGIGEFAILVEAFGSFLARADIEFHDGHRASLWRYIDIEGRRRLKLQDDVTSRNLIRK